MACEKVSLNKFDEKELVQAVNQTKEWRKAQNWYKGGKKNECEKYQRELFEKIVGQKCIKTIERLNMFSGERKNKAQPLRHKDGFDWTENFDGFIKSYNMFINFKMVCGSGGAQTRTLREVYWFIYAQIKNLEKDSKVVYANILDGNESYLQMGKYGELLKCKLKEKHKNRIFVGDMAAFYLWFNKLFTAE